MNCIFAALLLSSSPRVSHIALVLPQLWVQQCVSVAEQEEEEGRKTPLSSPTLTPFDFLRYDAVTPIEDRFSAARASYVLASANCAEPVPDGSCDHSAMSIVETWLSQ